MAVQSLRRERREVSRTRALAASGARIGERINAEQIRRLNKPWQTRAFTYYDLIPEVWYAAQFYSRHMSKVELRVEHYDDATGEWVPAPGTPASDLLERIQDPGGGRTNLIATYGRLRFLIGECYLVCLNPETTEESWEILSTSELKPIEGKKGGYKRVPAEGVKAEDIAEAPDDNRYSDLPLTAQVWRLWRRHPQYSMAADAPMRAVMDICEELLLLTLAVRAQARSRIAKSGLLLLPSEISPPPMQPVPGEDPMEDAFLRNLAAHIEAPLQDEGSTAQLSPLIVRGPAAYLRELRQLQLHVAGADYPEAALRSEAVGRLATGLDMPREALLGTADVNHWGSWQIDQQTFVAHVQPVLEEFCDELTSAILQPALLGPAERSPAERVAARTEARRWRIWYDPVKITNHPDRGKDATDLYAAGELSGEAYREAKGFDATDEPTMEERARWIGVRVRDAGLAWYGVPTAKAGATPEEDPGTDPGAETQPTDGGTGNDATTGPPSQEQAARLLGAAEAALLSCRRTAGSRIITKAPRAEQSALKQYEPRHSLYATLGEAAVRRMNGGGLSDRDALVRGGTESLETQLAMWGYPPERVAAISRLVLRHAAETLHERNPRALPPIIMNL